MEKLGIVEFDQLEIEHIRSWLANLQSTGVARSTLTRRIVSIRAFTNWAAANGWLTSDLGVNLAVPKPHKVLPEVLNLEEAATVLKALEVKAAEEPSALTIRDLALVEVLYGSGIRVSELCGLNLGDVDRTRNTLNVIGKGDKQRVVPIGLPALAAIDNYLSKAQSKGINLRKISDDVIGISFDETSTIEMLSDLESIFGVQIDRKTQGSGVPGFAPRSSGFVAKRFQQFHQRLIV